jgi:hypothetical protein
MQQSPQIMLDLVILGLVVRLVLNAVKRGQERHIAPTPPADDARRGPAGEHHRG